MHLSGKPCQNDTPDNMTQQRWKGSLDCISEYTIYTFDKQGRQDWKPAHSETLLSSVSLWMIFIITIWISRILWPRCWFCTSSERPVWFHFTHICWKIAQGIWHLGTTSLSLFCSDYSSSYYLCRYMALILHFVVVSASASVLKSLLSRIAYRCWETVSKISGHR